MDIPSLLSDLLHNRVLQVAFISVLAAQCLKVPFYRLTNARFDITVLWNASSFPSSHAAFVSSMAMMVGLVEGFSSALFGLSAVFALVVMYDAMGVRKEVGIQAEMLNYLMELRDEHDEYSHLLLERVGHTPVQVLGGAVLGLLIAVLIYYV